MLVEDAEMQKTLRRIVVTLAPDSALHDDLNQEGLIGLWRAEQQRPGRTRSWYLQSCKFHVQHYLAFGRSVDSPKRSNSAARVSLADTVEGVESADHCLTCNDVTDCVGFRDLVAVLSRHLTRRQQIVLQGLADGLCLREVASTFKLSYPTALKYRRRIAQVALKLGVPAPVSRSNPASKLVREDSRSEPAVQTPLSS